MLASLSCKDTKQVLLHVATALRYLHSQGYAFNNIKPDNIMLDEVSKDIHIGLISWQCKVLVVAPFFSCGKGVLWTNEDMKIYRLIHLYFS